MNGGPEAGAGAPRARQPGRRGSAATPETGVSPQREPERQAPTQPPSPLPGRDQTLVHFYRAVVAHMDVWRTRMDATTNWAVATTAGMMTFSFTSPAAPHLILLMSLAFDTMFLIMESRRYQMFDLWRRRFRTLNHYLIAPTLAAQEVADPDVLRKQYASIAADLGRTVPHLTLADALGYRLRRNYGYLITIGILAWLLKLEIHPVPAGEVGEFIARAAVGPLPGSIVFTLVFTFFFAALMLALRAPSEQMLGWAEVPSPLTRWWRHSRKLRRARRISSGKRRPSH